MLARQMLYHLTNTTNPFYICIFNIGSSFMPGLAWIMTLLFVLSQIARDDRSTSLHPTIGQVGLQELFAQAGFIL
jgi:hypothetical protein